MRVQDDLHGRITAAAGKAGVPYIMPNVYGYPLDKDDIQPDNIYGKMSLGRLHDVVNNGVSSYIALSSGFWYEWSLCLADGFGFDVINRKATLLDEGKRRITVSTWEQCGRGVAQLLSLPESGAEGPSLADFKNKSACIYSFSVSQRDMLDSLNRVMSTTDKDWDIKFESAAERVQEAGKKLQEGDRSAFGRYLYGGVFESDSKAYDFATTSGSDNDVLNLPKEDLDEATKRAVEMFKTGALVHY